MTASLRALIALVVAVAALGLAAVLEPRRVIESADHALLPHFDPGAITELSWPHTRVVRAHEVWNVVDPKGDADPETVANVLSALRGGRWQRRAARSAAGQVHAALGISAGSTTSSIAIGDALAGADQVWLVIGDHALLVDGWIARAIDPPPLALHARHPLEAAEIADAISLTDHIRLEGHPRNVVWADDPSRSRAGGTLLLDAKVATQFERALAELEYVALPSAALGAGLHTLRLEKPDVELHDAGPCPGHPELVGIVSSRGDGCVTSAQWRAVLAVIEKLENPVSIELVDRQLSREPPKQITFVDHGHVIGVLDATQATITIDHVSSPADRQRIRELQTALVAQATPAKPGTRAKMIRELLVPAAIDLDADGVAYRGFTALRPSADAWKILIRPPNDYRDITRWIEDPSSITAITIDAVTYTRGAVIGEWTRSPPGAFDAANLEKLAAALAIVRAPASAAQLARAQHVTLTITPPVGAASKHELDIGVGCIGRIDGAIVALPAAICTALAEI